MDADIAEVMADEINRHKSDAYSRHWSLDHDHQELHRLNVNALQRLARNNGYKAPRTARSQLNEKRRSKTRVIKARVERKRAKAATVFAHTCIFASGVCRCGAVRA